MKRKYAGISYPGYHDFAQADLGQVALCRLSRGLDVPTQREFTKRQKGGVAGGAFPATLHRILQESAARGLEHIIAWETHGRAFKVFRHDLLETHVLPMYYDKGLKVQSFLRQLHYYGFLRINALHCQKGEDDDDNHSCSYYHECFLRSRPDLVTLILRRQEVRHSRRQKGMDLQTAPVFASFSTVPLSPTTTTMMTTMTGAPSQPLQNCRLGLDHHVAVTCPPQQTLLAIAVSEHNDIVDPNHASFDLQRQSTATTGSSTATATARLEPSLPQWQPPPGTTTGNDATMNWAQILVMLGLEAPTTCASLSAGRGQETVPLMGGMSTCDNLGCTCHSKSQVNLLERAQHDTLPRTCRPHCLDGSQVTTLTTPVTLDDDASASKTLTVQLEYNRWRLAVYFLQTLKSYQEQRTRSD